MIDQEKIIDFVKKRGPILPAQIAKLTGTNILMASAHLSELVSSKKMLLSYTKIGGSPVYYIRGQEIKLQELYKYLNEKDQRTFNILKEKKILQDDKLDLLMRVSLRNIKDFAVPLHVTNNENKLLFWKWYLLDNDEAESLIGVQLKQELKKTKKLEIERKRKTTTFEKKKPEEESRIKQKKLIQKIKEKQEAEKIKPIKEVTHPFLDLTQNYFNKKQIGVSSYKIIRRKSEIDFIINVPSVVGNLSYYCKAKNKKKVSDSDLSSAFVQGQLKKLPVLFLITGDLTKKAKELLNTEFKKGLIVKKI